MRPSFIAILIAFLFANCNGKNNKSEMTDCMQDTLKADSLVLVAKNMAIDQGIDTSLYAVDTILKPGIVQFDFVKKGTQTGRGWPFHFSVIFAKKSKPVLIKGR